MISIPGYRILHELASGSSGTVYRAVQEGLGREVALKILSPGLFDAEETRLRFLSEAKIQAGLSHQNLLALYDGGFAGATPYMAVELIEGGTLRQFMLAKERLAAQDAVRLAQGIAAGLAHAQLAGIVHRDLKPENILLTLQEEPKIADFGLARTDSACRTLQTASGILLGTPGYMAPEVLQGERAGPPADVYALGVMLYEMMAGRRPFDAADLSALLTAQLTGKPVRMAELGQRMPAALERLLLSCLDPLPGGRPAAQALSSSLAAIDCSSARRFASGSNPTTVNRPVRADIAEPPERTQAGPARSRPSRDRSSSATVVRSPSSSELARPPGESPWQARLLLVAGGVLLLASAGYFQGRRAESLAIPPSNPSSPPAPPAAAVPLIARIATGSGTVTLHLKTPAPERLRWRLAAADTPVTSAEFLPFGDGAHWASRSGLAAGMRYEGELSLEGTAPRTFAFGTHSLHGTGQALRLGSSLPVASFSATAEGKHVLVAWRREVGKIERAAVACESFDEGGTWTEEEVLSEPNAIASRPAVALSSGVGLVAFEAAVGTPNGAFFRFKSPDAQRFAPSIGLPGKGHDPGLVAMPGGRFEGAIVTSDGGPRSELIPLRCASGPPTVVPLAGGIDHPHRHGGRICCQLLRCGDRLLVVSIVEEKPNRAAIQLRSSDDPARLGWSEMRRLTLEAENIDGEIDVASEGRRVALVFLADGKPQLLLSFDAGESFTRHLLPTSGSRDFRAPAVQFRDGQVYCLTPRLDPIRRKALCTHSIYRSRDGNRWELVVEDDLDLLRPKLTRFVLTPNRAVVFSLENVDGLLVRTLPLRR